jgi:[acyl-carrier-protein] S-malonyltransferase
MAYALLFPGQGAQSPGMGRALYDAFPESRATFDEADEALGGSIRKVCFEGSADDLALTENTQPAILTVSVAALRALRCAGVPEPVAAAGHSLGEYSAHVAADTLDFAGAVATVRRRGRFMQDAVPVGAGAMAAILGLDLEVLERLCREHAGDEVVSPANLNAPGQVVVAGHRGAVERVVAAAKEAGARRAMALPVSAPFHCSLMEPAAERLAPILEDLAFRDPRWPVYTNVDGTAVTRAPEARSALIRQVASPVRWVDEVRAMVESGIETFVEVGPGKVLSGLVRRIHRGADVHAVEDPAGVERVARELGGQG